MDQCRQIAKTKEPDLNANDIEAGAKIIAGTARSMGIIVEGHNTLCGRARFGSDHPQPSHT